MKTNKKSKQMFRLTVLYAILAFFFCSTVLYFLNASMKTKPALIDNKLIQVTKGISELIPNLSITNVSDTAENVSFTTDDKYCTFLYKSKIYIKEIATNKLVRKISETGISKSLLMSDRDIILYFCVANNSIDVKTYNIESNKITKQKSIPIPRGSIIKSVDYSSSTNLVFINLEEKVGRSITRNSIYYLNIMKNLKHIIPGQIINNMVLLNNSLNLYFEDNNKNLFSHSKLVSSVKKVNIIGCDKYDNVYVQSVEDKSKIYILNNQKIIKTKKLIDPAYIGFYTNKKDVFAIYKDYLINISGDVNIKFINNSNLKFVGMGGSNVYFKDANNNIVAMKRK